MVAKQQRIFYNNHLCNWNVVNKGTTQGSVSGTYLLNIFLNDLEISYNNAPALFKYADDSKMVSPVSNQCDPSANLVGQFMTWSKDDVSKNRILAVKIYCIPDGAKTKIKMT